LLAIEFFWASGSCLEALAAWWLLTVAGWRVVSILSGEARESERERKKILISKSAISATISNEPHQLLGFTCLPLLITVALIPWVPESPRWLLAKGDASAARASLLGVATTNRVALPRGWRLVQTHATPSQQQQQQQQQQQHTNAVVDDDDNQNDGLLTNKVLSDEDDNAVVVVETDDKPSLWSLFAPSLRRGTLLLMFLWFSSAFCYCNQRYFLLSELTFFFLDGVILITNAIFEFENKGQRCASLYADEMMADAIIRK
jgi:hypothetical protein